MKLRKSGRRQENEMPKEWGVIEKEHWYKYLGMLEADVIKKMNDRWGKYKKSN